MSEFLNPIFIFVELGGPVVAILLFLSVIALALAGLKATKVHDLSYWFLCKSQTDASALEKGNRSEASQELLGTRSAFEKTLLVAMGQIYRGKSFREYLEDEIAGWKDRSTSKMNAGLCFVFLIRCLVLT